MRSIKLQINGMCCNGCAMSIENMLKTKEFINEAKVDFSSKTANVKFDQNKVKRQEIIEAITKVGYEVKEA